MYITNEKLFKLLFDNNTDAIIWADVKKGTIIKCNKAAEILFERDKYELINQSITILHPPEKFEYV